MTKTKTKPVRMTKKARLEELRAAVSLCFHSMEYGDDPKEIANQTLLSVSTIRRLQAGEFSLAVRFGTIQAIAMAAGLRIELTESSVRLAVVN